MSFCEDVGLVDEEEVLYSSKQAVSRSSSGGSSSTRSQISTPAVVLAATTATTVVSSPLLPPPGGGELLPAHTAAGVDERDLSTKFECLRVKVPSMIKVLLFFVTHSHCKSVCTKNKNNNNNKNKKKRQFDQISSTGYVNTVSLR